MGIYIFEPSGATTPTLQQVLTAGSVLSVNNSIVLYYNTSLLFDLNAGAQLTIGEPNKDGVMYFDMATSSSSCCETYAKQNNGLTMVRNYFEIDPNLKQYNFGDFQQLSNGTYMTMDDVNERVNIKGGVDIINTTNDFTIEETSAGNGQISLSGTGFTVASHGANASVHLKIRINGNNYVIQLKNP
jgi:hypothetical protein